MCIRLQVKCAFYDVDYPEPDSTTQILVKTSSTQLYSNCKKKCRKCGQISIYALK
jgi:hypothetical protein